MEDGLGRSTSHAGATHPSSSTSSTYLPYASTSERKPSGGIGSFANVRNSMHRSMSNNSGFVDFGAPKRDYASDGESLRMTHAPVLHSLGTLGSHEPSTLPPRGSSSGLPLMSADGAFGSGPTNGACDPNGQGRAYRSRKDRPCDSCRKRKGRCIIEEVGMDCQSCRLNGRSCTFRMSPTPRSRPIKNEDGITIQSVVIPRKRSQSDNRKSVTASPGSQLTERINGANNGAEDSVSHSGDATSEASKSRKCEAEPVVRPTHSRPVKAQDDYREPLPSQPAFSVGGSRPTPTPFKFADHANEAMYDTSAQATARPNAETMADAPRHLPSVQVRQAQSSTTELFSLITSMVQGKDSGIHEDESDEAARSKSFERSRRGPEEEKGMMPMAIGSSSSEDPMLLRQAGSPTESRRQRTKREDNSSATSTPTVFAASRRPDYDRETDRPMSGTASGDGGTFGPLQVRQVASDPHHPIFFAFVPSHPYGLNRVKGHEIGAEGLAQLKDSLGVKIGHLMVLYSQRDSAAFPLLSETQRRNFREAAEQALEACRAAEGDKVSVEVPLEPVLANATLATPTVYDQSLRPISKRAWGANLKALTEQFDISTLVTLQVALTDLTGRPSINTSGNFMSFCQTLAISHMLGLHLDCTGWNMPSEEKDVRIRLWWATVIHDKWSSLCWGRPSMIHAQDHTVPLPRRNSLSPCHSHLNDEDLARYSFGRGWASDRTDAHTPGDTFVGLCRLTVILADILEEFHSIRPQQGLHRDAIATAQRIKNYFVLLEDWKDVLPPTLSSVLKGDEEGGQGTQSIPGTRSLQLSYLGVNLLLCRAALDSVTKRAPQDTARLSPAHRTSLQGALMIVEFLEALTQEDYTGFFLHYCSHHLASCLSLLGRLCFGFSQMGDEDMLATSVATIQRLLVTLSDAHRIYNWDLAELALTRSRAILPALEARIPDFPRYFRADTRGSRQSSEKQGPREVGPVTASPALRLAVPSGAARLPTSEGAFIGTHGSNPNQTSRAFHSHVSSSGDEISGPAISSAVPQQRADIPEGHQARISGSIGQSTQPISLHAQHPSNMSSDNLRNELLPREHAHGQWLPPDLNPLAMTHDASGLAPATFDKNIFVFDGHSASITVDAAGVPFPQGMSGTIDVSAPMQNRLSGGYIVDGSTSGAGHLMSGVDFDWLMLPQQHATPYESASNAAFSAPQPTNGAFVPQGPNRTFG